jgi:hypothetical protein
MEDTQKIQRIIGLILFATSIIGLIYFLSQQAVQNVDPDQAIMLMQPNQTPKEAPVPTPPTVMPTPAPQEAAPILQENTHPTTAILPPSPQETPNVPSLTTPPPAQSAPLTTQTNPSEQPTNNTQTNQEDSPWQTTLDEDPPLNQPVRPQATNPPQTYTTDQKTSQPTASNHQDTDVTATQMTTDPSPSTPQHISPTSVPQPTNQTPSFWTVQFGVFHSLTLAQKMQHDLAKTYNIATTIIQQEQDNGITVARILLSEHYKTHQKAQNISQALSKRHNVQATLYHHQQHN